MKRRRLPKCAGCRRHVYRRHPRVAVPDFQGGLTIYHAVCAPLSDPIRGSPNERPLGSSLNQLERRGQ